MLRIKRIYDDVSDGDGFRVLVDRLWPRGVSKEKAHLDAWMKGVAPSNELRTWYHKGEGDWTAFRKAYFDELERNKDDVDELLGLSREHEVVTLLYAAKDREQNNAAALKEYLVRVRGDED
ncbi:MAG TPA: DUF488 family protein [Methanomicrobia archaeon]|nr:DUF488 family protein [Methanomicrobia archaeon]